MMRNPPHPGLLLHEEIVVERGITVSGAADRLGLTRTALSRVLNGHAGISPNLALRLEEAGVGTARLWIAMQGAYDQAERDRQEKAMTEFTALENEFGLFE